MGSFDINSFKNAFLSEMARIANSETVSGQIDTQGEIQAANNAKAIFKSELASNPIGDSFQKTNADAVANEVSVDDLMALLDDPELNVARVNELIQEKPAEALGNLSKVGSVKRPEETTQMAELSDADTEGVNFYTDKAIAEGRNIDIAMATDSAEEGIDALGYNFYDAFMEALYAA